MRERIQGIIAIVICVLVCITFIFFGIENYLKSQGDADVIAKVNGVKITQKQVRIAYERTKQQLMANMGKNYAYDQKMQEKIKSEITQGLIKSEALLQGLKKLKFTASPAQINAIVQQLPAFQANGHFSEEKFHRVLSNMMLLPADFFNELKNSIMINQLRNGLIMSSFILPNETNNAIKLLNQMRDIRYAIITIDSLKNSIQLSDQEIQDYYQKHQEEFKMSEQISISYIELFADSLQSKVNVTADEALQYYKSHIDKYSVKDKIHSFAKVQEQVTKAVRNEKLAQLFSEQSNKLADLAYTNSESLLPAATELGLPIKSSNLFTERGEKTGILANKKIVSAAFSDTVLKQNYNSDLIELEPGHVLVMRVKEYKTAAIRPLSEVKSQIVQQLTNVAAQQKAKDLGEKLVAALKSDLSANAIKQHGLAWKVHKIKRQGTANLDPLIIRAAFSVVPNDGQLGTMGLVLQNGDFAMVQVDKIYAGDSNSFDKKQLKSFKHNMAAVLGDIDYNLLVEDLIKQSKIKEYGK